MKKTTSTAAQDRFDRPGDTPLVTCADETPWETATRRGALELSRDNAQHRRYHSLFEDLLN